MNDKATPSTGQLVDDDDQICRLQKRKSDLLKVRDPVSETVIREVI